MMAILQWQTRCLPPRSAQTEEEATAPYYGADGDPLTGDSLDDLINGTSGDDMMLGRVWRRYT